MKDVKFKLLLVCIVAGCLVAARPAAGITVISQSANTEITLGYTGQMEFENPLSGTEMVKEYAIIEWRDADYAAGTPPWYDDWSVSHPGQIDGDSTHIWMRQQGHSIWTSTTVPSKTVSIHMDGDGNDGKAEVLVDGSQVAVLDMLTPPGAARVLIIVKNLAYTTHNITINDLGVSPGGGQAYQDDVSTLGAAALEKKIKWAQPPEPTEPANLYYGWNEYSVYEGQWIVADDWPCETLDPVTDIHWWGSFENWKEPEPPEMPQSFYITIWTNVPASADEPFSHPGKVIWENDCYDFHCDFVGWDYDPRTRCYEACFRFDQFLRPDEFFYQEPNDLEPTIYWLSIAAKYPDDPAGTIVEHPWGWKTRPHWFEDDAVRIFDPTAPHVSDEYVDGEPIEFEDESWDMAFELTTQPLIEVIKYEQPPDLSYRGIDVDATGTPMPPAVWPPQLLADDFPCWQTGEITDIHIYGSWYYDDLPDGDPNNVIFTLSFHNNNPGIPGGWSEPNDLLWTCKFGPGQFTVEKVPTFEWEAYYCPCIPQPNFFPNNHVGVYRYSFYLSDADCDPFIQEGGQPDDPCIYWLDVQAQPLDMYGYARFGWKTSFEHWMDDAVWAVGWEGNHGPWTALFHPISPAQSLDLAFEITTVTPGEIDIKWSQPPKRYIPEAYYGWNEYSVYDSHQIAADDWFCETDDPVTDIHWWGSFIGWSCEEEPPLIPEAFHIAIWTDVPGATKPWSNPGKVIWETICEEFTCEFVGWDIDPRNLSTLPAPPEACFKFEQDILEDEWFEQPYGDHIYWVSISAIYPTGVDIEYPWGWKTLPHDWDSPAPDDAVRIFDPCAPVLDSRYIYGEPIEWPVGQSWDLAFVLTTKEIPPEPKPKPEHLKWSQPPIERWPDPCDIIPPYYCGWDEPSWYKEPFPIILFPPRVADDFRCIGSGPVTSIHWWGSHVKWGGQQPPQPQPIAWQFTFFSNIPADPTVDPNFSEPGNALWWFMVDTNRVHSEFAGWDEFIDNPFTESCFQYYVDLESNEYFWQHKEEPNTIDNIFWLSIEAVYPNDVDVIYPWGWKTRPWSWMDDAVKRKIIWPIVGLPYWVWEPIKAYGESYDVAFELDTDPNYIKWEQAYCGIRQWPHYEDELSMATVERWTEVETKWLQKPDLSPNGIDVDATTDELWQPQVLADDFPCTEYGPITDIHIWGSWYHDHPPFDDPNNVAFTLSIHENIPPYDPCYYNPYSMPGQLLWMKTFYPGDFDVWEETPHVPEGWFVPCSKPPYYDPYADNICWFYSFFIDDTEAFWQEPDNIYWLDVQAHPFPEPCYPEPIRFGWKDSYDHFEDNAVWAVGQEPIGVLGPWQPMWYPPLHPLAGGPIDLAFAITTYGDLQWIQWPDLEPDVSIDIDATRDIWQSQALADDFNCTSTDPITDIHIWGSWLKDFLAYNAIFTLSIHEDIPVGDPINPYDYSVPGAELWRREFWPGEYNVWDFATGLQEGWYVPCAKDPYEPYYEPDADWTCFQYDFYIPESEAFVQEGDPCEPVIYWLAVNARLPVPDPGIPIEPIRPRFGWKSRDPCEHFMDDAVWSDDNGDTWNELRYPLGHMYEGHSIDLAFSITTEKEHEEFVLQRRVADDWLCERETPITAAVWWGSYLGFPYKPCETTTMQPPLPVKPDYFLLTIWDDVPDPDPCDPSTFSRPNNIIWQYNAYDYDEVLVGYDKHPHGAPQEPVFRYSVRLPKESWFLQEDVNNIYWFSVVAVYDENEPIYEWGWTNHKHYYNDDAAAWEMDASGLWSWVPLEDQNDVTEDMSFILFTEPECLIGGNAGSLEYSDWVAWGKPDCWCYQRQCRGDIDGKRIMMRWVQGADLTIFRNAFLKSDAQLAAIPNGICADLDHKKIMMKRVQGADLTILRTYFLKPDAAVPICDQAPIITGPYNFWTKP